MITRNVYIGSLIFAVAGAFFFCLSLNSTSTSHDMSTENTTTAHILHAQELTSATIVLDSILLSTIFFLSLAFIFSLFSRELNLFIQKEFLYNLRWRKRKETFSCHKANFLRWLSLSINSPAYTFVM